MKTIARISTGITLSGALVLSSCTVNPHTGEQQVSKTVKGSLIGAAGGAALGALIGNNRKGGKSREGAIKGGIAGLLVGAGIGQYMDYQEAQIRKELEGTNVTVSRAGDNLTLNMPSDITFASGKSSLAPQFTGTLDSVAQVVSKYDKTQLSVIGHTDSDGSYAYNQGLSDARARTVANYLSARGVASGRLNTYGKGETQPIASNSSANGKAQNRRVEVRIVPVNDQF